MITCRKVGSVLLEYGLYAWFDNGLADSVGYSAVMQYGKSSIGYTATVFNPVFAGELFLAPQKGHSFSFSFSISRKH